jgi:hypothetical protein
MRSIYLGKKVCIVFIWYGWRYLRFRPNWYIKKWQYFHATSWKHGSAGLRAVKIVW